MTNNVRIQIRRDSSGIWTTANPTLAQGEMGYENDTGFLKIGDGTTAWNDLEYFSIKQLRTGNMPDSDQEANGIIVTFTAGEIITAGKGVVVASNGEAELFDETMDRPCVGIAIKDATTGNSVKVLTHGTYRNDSMFDFPNTNYTIGQPLYPTGSNGTLSQEAPSDSGDHVQRVGVPISSDCILVNISLDILEVL